MRGVRRDGTGTFAVPLSSTYGPEREPGESFTPGPAPPQTRTDDKNFNVPYSTSGQEGVFIPANWTASTFLSLRPFDLSDPAYTSKVLPLNGTDPAPVFNYHRFWAEGDIATAMDTFAFLFPSVRQPARF